MQNYLNDLGAGNFSGACALLDKRSRRLVESPIRFVGFEVGDDFLVGYGLDFQGRYRNLPFISVLKPELYRADLSG